MARQWTPDQQTAIDHRAGNLLLSAAAGSGKTAVLVARVLGLITDNQNPVDVDRLLVVTFTEAAAREMKHRIGRELSNRIADDNNEVLARQLALISRAQISTIHAFCLTVLRRCAFEMGLDPSFTVLDGLEANVLLHDAVAKVIERRVAEMRFADLVRCFGEEVYQALPALFHLSRTHPQPELWLDGVEKMFTVGTSVSDLPWTRVVLAAAGEDLVRAGDKLAKAMKLTQLPDGPEAYQNRLLEEQEMVDQLAAACASEDWVSFQRLIQSYRFGRLPSASGADKELSDQAKQLRTDVKKIVDKLCPLAHATDDQLLADLHVTGNHVRELVTAVREVNREYKGMKERWARVDFADLELGCYRLLSRNNGDNELVRQLRDRYRYVLVDEFQDTNPLQDAIISMMTGEDRLFAVGDVRQSIFGFRLAEPEVFTNRVRQYEGDGGGTALRLSHNFRSRPEIIDNINFLFGQLGWEEGSDLIAGADYLPPPADSGQGKPVELIIVDKQGAASEDDLWVELSNLEREAVIAGERIRSMLDGSFVVWDDKTEDYRPMRPGDVAVLLRATRWKAEVVVSVLERLGISAYASTQTGLLDAPEASALVSLLRVVDNPRQDIHLASALHTVGRFTYEQIAVLRQSCPQGDMYDALISAVDTDCAATDFLSRLNKWRRWSQLLPVADLIWALLRDTGYYDYVGGLPAGKARRANLRAICDWGASFHAQGTSLTRFLAHVDRVVDMGVDLGSAPVFGEGDDVVRVMSIHKSKGLEFPLVLLLDMGRRIEAGDRPHDIMVHRRLGVGAAVVDLDNHAVYPSLALAAVRRALSMDQRDEELRVLYVGLTRARERLIVIGSVPDTEKSIQGWQDIGFNGELTLRTADVAGAHTYLDLIMSSVVRHHTGSIGDYPPVPAVPPVAEARANWAVSVVQSVPITWSTDDKEMGGDEAGDDELIRRCEWLPTRTGWDAIAAKVAATELKRQFEPGHEDGVVWSRIDSRAVWPLPDVMRSDEPQPHERGLAVHRFLQHVDLNGQLDKRGLECQLEDMVSREIIAPEMGVLVNVDDVARLFTCAIGQLIVDNRHQVQREVPFMMAVPAEDIYNDVARGGPPVVVQGVIDCVIVSDHGLTIVDFKHSPPEHAREAKEQGFADQLAIYSKAAGSAYGKPVIGACVVYVSSGEVLWFSGTAANS